MKKAFFLLIMSITLSSCSTTSQVNTIESLKVKRLALVDDNGVERVLLTTKSTDVPILGKVYKRKSPAVGIILYNAKGDETGGLAMLNDGTVSLTLDGYRDKKFSERASIYVLPDGTSGILVKDLKNNIRVRLGVDKDMKSTFEVLDAKGKSKIKSIVSKTGKVKFVK